jgi:hypothetical protein
MNMPSNAGFYELPSNSLEAKAQEMARAKARDQVQYQADARTQAQAKQAAKQADDRVKYYASEDAEIKAKKDQEIKKALTDTAVDLYNEAMNKMFATIGKTLFGPTDLFNPMHLPVSFENAKENLSKTTNIGFSDQQWRDVQKIPQNFTDRNRGSEV